LREEAMEESSRSNVQGILVLACRPLLPIKYTII